MDKKRQLLDAAERVYCEYGNLGLTVRRLAAEGDTTSQTIYTYFGSRDAVIVAMYERIVAGLEQLLGPLREQLDAPNGDAAAQLVDVAQAYRRHCLEYPAHFKMLAEGRGPEDTDPGEIMALQGQLVELVGRAQTAAGVEVQVDGGFGARQAIAQLQGLIKAELDGFLDGEAAGDEAMRAVVSRAVGVEFNSASA